MFFSSQQNILETVLNVSDHFTAACFRRTSQTAGSLPHGYGPLHSGCGRNGKKAAIPTGRQTFSSPSPFNSSSSKSKEHEQAKNERIILTGFCLMQVVCKRKRGKPIAVPGAGSITYIHHAPFIFIGVEDMFCPYFYSHRLV